MDKNDALVAARKEKGFTQEGLAGLLGYSKAAVSNWENGHAQPSLPDAFRLATILNKDINILFAGLFVQEQCMWHEEKEAHESQIKDTG